MAAARQNEIKLSIAVVATTTLATECDVPAGFVEALVQFLPVLGEIVHSGEAAPFREAGTNNVRAIGIVAVGKP